MSLLDQMIAMIFDATTPPVGVLLSDQVQIDVLLAITACLWCLFVYSILLLPFHPPFLLLVLLDPTHQINLSHD